MLTAVIVSPTSIMAKDILSEYENLPQYSAFTSQQLYDYEKIILDKNIDAYTRTQYILAMSENRVLTDDEIKTIAEKAQWIKNNPPYVPEEYLKNVSKTKNEMYEYFQEQAENSPHMSDSEKATYKKALDDNKVIYLIDNNGVINSFTLTGDKQFDDQTYGEMIKEIEKAGTIIANSYLGDYKPQ